MIKFFELIGKTFHWTLFLLILGVLWPTILCLVIYDKFLTKFEPAGSYGNYKRYYGDMFYNGKTNMMSEGEFNRLETAKFGFQLILFLVGFVSQVGYWFIIGNGIAYLLTW